MKTAVCYLILLLAYSCASEIRKPAPPKDLISQEKMVEITKELVLIEGHVDLSYKIITKYHKIVKASTDAVFNKYGVSRARYGRSFDYYAADQEKLTEIYAAVLDELTLMKGEQNTLVNK